MLNTARIATVVSILLGLAGAANADCSLAGSISLPGHKHAYRLADGSIVFLGRLAVDADGSPKAYNPKSRLGLDDLVNAGRPGHWWAIATNNCKSSGTPVVQGPNDPAPGFYVSTTSMTDLAIPGCSNPAKYLDSEKIPFVALAPRIARFNFGKSEGNLVAALAPSGKSALAVFGDVAPPDGIGEGSIAFVQALGYNPSARSGGTPAREIAYVIFAATMGFPKDAPAVTSASDTAFTAWGGIDRLKECKAALERAPR
jgi:hypothetical protein